MVSENQADPQDEIILDPGEQIIYSDHAPSFTKTNVDYNFSLGWKDGLLVLREADVMHIKRKLERWYGVQIEIRGVPNKSWKINGTFKNQSLERVLERLAFSKEFTFQLSDKNVIMNFTNQKTS
jgi:ferric-dicitrate binding protein FerR (iron transport regulator)